MSEHVTPTHRTENWVLDATDGICPQCLIERAEQAERALAEAEERILESPFISGCIEVVTTLVQKGYGTSRDNVVEEVDTLHATLARVEWERDHWKEQADHFRSLLKAP